MPLTGSLTAYEGNRRGIKGRGGAGVRGYLVSKREEVAPAVGDLRDAGDISAAG